MANYVHATVGVGTTATLIFTSPSITDGAQFRNNGPAAVYLGGSSVTADVSSTGGLQVNPGETIEVSTVGNINADLYGVTAVGTAYVSYLWV